MKGEINIMKPLPDAEVYVKENQYMPWGKLIQYVVNLITAMPKGLKIIDLMCGPGYLLNEIKKVRPDLILNGVDIDENFIKYAQLNYPDISFQTADVLVWKPIKKYDVVLCTGGIHHLPYDKQVSFLYTIPAALKKNGFAFFADTFIDDYLNESERKIAAARLGYEYLVNTIKNGALNDIISAGIDILHNDVMGNEFKTSLTKLLPIFNKLFVLVNVIKIWPQQKSDYGDYIIYCKGAK